MNTTTELPCMQALDSNQDLSSTPAVVTKFDAMQTPWHKLYNINRYMYACMHLANKFINRATFSKLSGS